MADINAVAQQFTTFYYQAFDADRSQLAPLYVRHFFFTFAITTTLARYAIVLICLLARLIDAYFRG